MPMRSIIFLQYHKIRQPIVHRSPETPWQRQKSLTFSTKKKKNCMHQAQSHFHQERLILSTSTFSTKKQLSLKVQFSSFEDLNFLSPTLISSMSTKLRQLDETDKREKGKLCKYHPVNALQLVNTRKQYIQHTKHQMKIRGEIHEVMILFQQT